eukprot:1157619-Pelagomonas_calceolata.AAC.17
MAHTQTCPKATISKHILGTMKECKHGYPGHTSESESHEQLTLMAPAQTSTNTLATTTLTLIVAAGEASGWRHRGLSSQSLTACAMRAQQDDKDDRAYRSKAMMMICAY